MPLHISTFLITIQSILDVLLEGYSQKSLNVENIEKSLA